MLDCHFASAFDLEIFQIFQACNGLWQLGDLCECVSFASFIFLLEFRIPGYCRLKVMDSGSEESCNESKAPSNSSAVQWIQAVKKAATNPKPRQIRQLSNGIRQ
eukprot:TRINITY_DN651_c0_g1_i11.p1 TRINITY_DN651_c0_g1~~TRINITY_DN651_c0_g1_i11.p1  ORF type:complete len:104 (-),score=13.17 TRINITY_DN651_c0_g1_i11:54-365(-)